MERESGVRGLSATGRGGQQRGGGFFVDGEEELDALTVGGEGLRATAALDGAIEAMVGGRRNSQL